LDRSGYHGNMITTEFVRGFMARFCQVDPSMREIVTTSNNGRLLSQVGMALRRNKILCTVSQVGTRWRLRIRGLDALKQWRSLVGFVDSERATKLDEIIRTLEQDKDAAGSN